MTLAFDAVGPSASGQTASNPASVTWAHTVTGSQTALVVFVGVGQNSGGDGTKTVASVTYNGVAMTALSTRHTDDSTFGYLAAYGLAAPATGTHNVVVTFNSAPSVAECGSLSFTGVDQTTPFGTPVTGAADSASASAAVASNTNGDLIAFGVCSGSDTAANPTAPATKRIQANFSHSSAGGCFGVATIPATGSSVTCTWAITSDFWALIAVEVKAAGAGGNSTPVTAATETDTGQAAGRTQMIATTPAAETDTGIAPGLTQTTGTAAETDTGTAVGRTRGTATTPAGETDTGQPAGRTQAQPAGPAAETDVGQPVAAGGNVPTTPAAETDTGQPAGRTATTTTATETDTGQAAARTRTSATSTATETDTGQAATRTRSSAALPAAELDTAGPAGQTETQPAGPAGETDTGQPVAGADTPVADLLLVGATEPHPWAAGIDRNPWTGRTEPDPWHTEVEP